MHLAAVKFLPHSISCPGLRTLVTSQFLTVLDSWLKKNSLLSLHYRETREREKASGQRTIRREEHERRKWGRAHEKQLFFLSLPRALHWGHPWQILSSRISNQKNRCRRLQSTVTDGALNPRPEFKLNAEQISQGLGSD